MYMVLIHELKTETYYLCYNVLPDLDGWFNKDNWIWNKILQISEA